VQGRGCGEVVGCPIGASDVTAGGQGFGRVGAVQLPQDIGRALRACYGLVVVVYVINARSLSRVSSPLRPFVPLPRVCTYRAGTGDGGRRDERSRHADAQRIQSRSVIVYVYVYVYVYASLPAHRCRRARRGVDIDNCRRA
jgi:hypothetical protein